MKIMMLGVAIVFKVLYTLGVMEVDGGLDHTLTFFGTLLVELI